MAPQQRDCYIWLDLLVAMHTSHIVPARPSRRAGDVILDHVLELLVALHAETVAIDPHGPSIMTPKSTQCLLSPLTAFVVAERRGTRQQRCLCHMHVVDRSDRRLRWWRFGRRSNGQMLLHFAGSCGGERMHDDAVMVHLKRATGLAAVRHGLFWGTALFSVTMHLPSPDTPTSPLRKRRCCVVCGSIARFKCGECMAVSYCSRQCQQQNWSAHSLLCDVDVKGGISMLEKRSCDASRSIVFFRPCVSVK